MPSFVTVPLRSVTTATPRSCLLSLDISSVGFSFRAGQAIVIGEHTQTTRRPYSIASSPEQAQERGRLELLVGLDAAGSPGPHLASMRAGTAIDLEGPMGSFTLPAMLARRLLFVAGGTGIAPLRSMIDHVLRADRAEQVALLYSARRADEFAFIEELRAHARTGRLELHQTVTRGHEGWAGGRGRIGRAHFEAVLHEPADTLCFICGPSAMVTEAVATLAQLGVPIDAIRTEQWSSKS
jgi:ferredoxin-NADP reductase